MEIPTASRETPAPDSTYAPASVIAEHYRVERELGRGGMATVYLCTDLRDQKQVAIKVLRHELGSAVVIERFLREIAFASELDHPQIPKVLGSGVIGDVPYYVMTYIEGESLKKRLEREKQLPIADALKISCAIIEPTSYAHKRGIVHRDIKPDNILLSKDGVFVLDFGIARAIIESGGDRLTSTGIGVGTPAYMSPEQALGDRNLDVRSDIYSIGCVVYEMIAGIPPFVGPTAQVIISRRFAAPPPPIRELREGVPEDLEYAIEKALAKSPADRWATADEFGAALKTCATGEHRFTSGSQRVWWRRPHNRAAAATLMAGIVAASAFGWSAAYREPFASGQRAVAAWDFDRAESEFRRAIGTRPKDPRSQLWLAQLMMLRGAPSADWTPSVVIAADNRGELSPEDQTRSDALVALASDQYTSACTKFGSISKAANPGQPAHLVSTLAYADCLRTDPSIIADTHSPTSYSFRSSAQLVDSLYEGLLERHRATPAAYSVLLPRLERVLPIEKGFLRMGRLLGKNPRLFLSTPSLDADTLVYVPVPLPSSGPWHAFDEAGLPAAITRNRQRLRERALQWRSIAADDPAAHETLARMLESTGELGSGDPSALGEISTARKLAKNSGGNGEDRDYLRLRLASTQVRLFLKLSNFKNAAALTDTILAWPVPARLDAEREDTVGNIIIGLAALRGQASTVIRVEHASAAHAQVRLSNGAPVTLTVALAMDEIAFGAYAAFGGTRDTLVTVLSRLKRNVTAMVEADQAEELRNAILRRPLKVAASVLGVEFATAEIGRDDDPYARALAAAARGDPPVAKRVLDSLTKSRVGYAPGEITMDVVFQESWLRVAIGDTVGANRDLDNALSGLPGGLSSILRDFYVAACLVRVMALKAELAAAANQPEVAKNWARAVIQLWGGGDSTVRPTVDRMRTLAGAK